MKLKFLLMIALAMLSVDTHAGLFGSKTTRAYKKLRDAAAQAGKAGKPNEQLQQLEAAHKVISADPDSTYFNESLISLGKFHSRHSLWWRAEPYYQQAVERALEKHGTNHLTTARAMFLHAQTLMELYRFEEAARELEKVEYTARWKTGRYSVTVGYCKARIGQLLVLRGEPAAAIPILEDSLRQMGRMRSFTTVSAVTSGVINNSLSGAGSSTAVYLPRADEVATVMIDYAIALRGAGREAEAEEALAGARETLVGKLNYSMPEFFIKRRFSEAAEATGDLARAEHFLYEAVGAAYRSPTATPREQRYANYYALGFHIRHGQDTKATSQETILLNKGLTLDDLDPYFARQSRLRVERSKARRTAK